jgi:hypothetical protein
MAGYDDGARRGLVVSVGRRFGKARPWVGSAAVGLVGLVCVGSTALAAVVQVPVLTTPRDEVQAAASDAFLAWSQNGRAHPHLYSVWARPSGGARFRVNHTGTQGFLGGIDGDTLAYQQIKRNQSDIKLFDLVTRVRRNPPVGVNTPAWEYRPTISGSWILFGRLRVSVHRRQIILFNSSTRQRIVLADRPEGSATSPSATPGQVNGNFAVWSQCTATACSVWEYDITAATKTRLPNTTPGQFNYAPSVDNTGTAYFAHSGRACGGATVQKRPIGGLTASVVTLAGSRDIEHTYLWTGATQLNLLFAKVNCRTGSGDIFKIISP